MLITHGQCAYWLLDMQVRALEAELGDEAVELSSSTETDNEDEENAINNEQDFGEPKLSVPDVGQMMGTRRLQQQITGLQHGLEAPNKLNKCAHALCAHITTTTTFQA